jgi:glycosyltransferase involved in cell wall biosynthesis
MINILYALNGVFHKGGTETVILNYFNNIDRTEYHIDFLVHGDKVANQENEAHKYLESCGSHIFYVTPRGKNYFANKREIRGILRNNQYDIVHSHMDAAGAFLLKEAESAGIKVRAAHSHNTNHQINKRNVIKNIVYKFVLNSAIKGVTKYGNLFIACSKEAGKWLFGDKEFIVLNNAIDVEKYIYNEKTRLHLRNQYNLNSNLIIGHVGRFSQQKNHQFIVEIFNEIYKQRKDAVLMLLGTGELEQVVKEKINSLGLQNNTVFMGNRSDVNELMQAMDVFILPSLFEGLPLVCIEAQATGLPCVVSDTVSKDVKITPDVTFLSLEKTPKEWADSILTVCKKTIRTNTKNDIVTSGYDIKRVVKQLEKTYTDKLISLSLLEGEAKTASRKLRLKTILKKIPGVQYYTWFRSSKIRAPIKFRWNELKIQVIKYRKKWGYSTDNDNELKKLKGIHCGESCVIIGNGPSLRIEDLEMLKENKIITFGCNRINKLFSKTMWNPDYYCLSDSSAFKASYIDMDSTKLVEDLLNANVKKIFFVESMKKYLNNKYINNEKVLFYRMSHVPPYSSKMKPFSDNISDSISDLGTVAGTCVQVAAYMGFTNICLYGIDNSFKRYFGSDEKFHIDLDSDDYADGIAALSPNTVQGEEVPKTEYQAAIRQSFVDLRKFDVGFMICADYANDNHIHIYNITRGGKLEIFERKNVEELFNGH